MAVYRMQVSMWWNGTLLPRDVMQINPVFNATIGLAEVDALCEELATSIDSWVAPNNPMIKVKAYDVEGTPPVFPAGEWMLNENGAPTADVDREVALCLSFYAGTNQPRRRGRLYVPMVVTGSTTVGLRPTGTHQSKVAELATICKDLGGVDIDWSVWSTRDQQAHAVTNWWVDNEWDVQRRRGLRPTARVEGTTSEATLLLRDLTGFAPEPFVTTSVQELQET